MMNPGFMIFRSRETESLEGGCASGSSFFQLDHAWLGLIGSFATSSRLLHHLHLHLRSPSHLPLSNENEPQRSRRDLGFFEFPDMLYNCRIETFLGGLDQPLRARLIRVKALLS